MLYRSDVCCAGRSHQKTLWINLLAFKIFSFFFGSFLFFCYFVLFFLFMNIVQCARWPHSIVFGPLFRKCIEPKEKLVNRSSIFCVSVCAPRVHLLAIPVMVFRIYSVCKSNTLNRLSVPLWCCHRCLRRRFIAAAWFSLWKVFFFFSFFLFLWKMYIFLLISWEMERIWYWYYRRVDVLLSVFFFFVFAFAFHCANSGA